MFVCAVGSLNFCMSHSKKRRKKAVRVPLGVLTYITTGKVEDLVGPHWTIGGNNTQIDAEHDLGEACEKWAFLR